MGTLLVNVSGSFAIGFFATLTSPEGRWLALTGFRQFFIYGVCGGYVSILATLVLLSPRRPSAVTRPTRLALTVP